jgi:hypothetical protein
VSGAVPRLESISWATDEKPLSEEEAVDIAQRAETGWFNRT